MEGTPAVTPGQEALVAAALHLFLVGDDEDLVPPLDPSRVRPLATVTPTTDLRDALRQLQAEGAHLTRVVDDDARLRGVATLEDVLEQLVGEVRDATQHSG